MVAMYNESRVLAASENFIGASQVAVGSGTMKDGDRKRLTGKWERDLLGKDALSMQQNIGGALPDGGAQPAGGVTPGLQPAAGAQ